MIKSGTDFEEFSDCAIIFEATEADYQAAKAEVTDYVKYLFSPQKKMLVRVEKVPIVASMSTDAEIDAHIEENSSELNKKMSEICAYFDVDLEGRFECLRYEETNIGNLVTDIIRTEYDNVDLVLLNSGTLRSNAVIQKGDYSLRMLSDLLPMPDKIVLLKINGKVL